jgi:trypsin-like peptidase
VRRTVIDPLLLTTVLVRTFVQHRSLTSASGFLFGRDERLYLVTSRHVLADAPSGHFPDRVEIEVHIDRDNVAACCGFAIPLYRKGAPLWRRGLDAAGEIDVAVVQLERAALPSTMVYRAFTPAHLSEPQAHVEVGSSVLVVGFPLGFHDTLHHMPVVRHAVVASSFALRFQGQGYFLTDGRTHSGSSGSPVVMRQNSRHDEPTDLPWVLLGVHASRLDMGTRDVNLDEALGLNCAWYADILLSLTE